MKDVSHQVLQDLITYIYNGQVNIEQDNLDEFLKTAKALKIKGLDDDADSQQPTGRQPAHSSFHQSDYTAHEQSLTNGRKRVNTAPAQSYPNQYQQSANEYQYQNQDDYKDENGNEMDGYGEWEAQLEYDHDNNYGENSGDNYDYDTGNEDYSMNESTGENNGMNYDNDNGSQAGSITGAIKKKSQRKNGE